MATVNIKGRKSIRRDYIPLSASSDENRNHHNSQRRFSGGYESDHGIKTDDSEESLIEQPSQSEKLKKQNDSARDISHTSSFRHEQSTSMTPESAVIVEQPFLPNFFLKWIVIVSTIITVVFSIWFCFYAKKECSFQNLRQKYPQESDHLWNHLQIGNENILNNESDKPAVYLFVHHGKQIAEDLINDIAWNSASCFGSKPNIKKISFTSKEALEDYGHVIEAFKKSTKEENVILIVNLNEIPGEAAQALHSICDTVSPLVKKVVILLSLAVNQQKSGEKIIDTAENALRQLWEAKMKPFQLDPIITRVTDQVLLLKSN